MNIQLRNRYLIKAISYAVLLNLVMLFAVTPASAGESVFEVGKTYLLDGSSKVKILSKPDKNGWVKVKPMDERTKRYCGDEGYANITTFSYAKESK